MERLSKTLADVLNECIDALSQVEEDIIQAALHRLAAYEDTGLAPEEIVALKEENQRLHSENFWLCQTPRPVLCENCRSGGMCQMEKIFLSEGIEEPFCCRGEVRSDG